MRVPVISLRLCCWHIRSPSRSVRVCSWSTSLFSKASWDSEANSRSVSSDIRLTFFGVKMLGISHIKQFSPTRLMTFSVNVRRDI